MTTKQPLVSIVLPSYNGERYLAESVESIFALNYPNLELILVDDCSTDTTGAMMDHYAEGRSNVHVIHNATNQRLPRSLNIGFRVAHGKYLTWTSDDNRYLPDAITRMVEVLEQHPETPLVCAGLNYIDEDGRVTGKLPPYDDVLIWEKDLIGACFLYRREVLDVVGEYDPEKVYVEDYDYWLRIYDKMGKFRAIPDTLYEYRYHNASLTTTKVAEVNFQRTKLRNEYQTQIFRDYADKPAILCALYYEYRLSGVPDSSFMEGVRKRVPILEQECMLADQGRVWIFGAGEYGREAAKLLGSRVAGFIDNFRDTKELYDGRPVVRLDEYLMQQQEGDQIFLALAMDHIYEVICQLAASGVQTYSTWHTWKGKQGSIS